MDGRSQIYLNSFVVVEIVTAFGISLAASVVAVGLVLWLERQRRPALTADVYPELVVPPGDHRPEATWLHIRVQNKPCPSWLSWVYQREPALGVRGHASFHESCGCKLTDAHMPVRWSSSPEVNVMVRSVGGQQVAYLENDERRVDVLANSPEGIHPIIVFPDGAMYGWTNESYAHSWRHPAWKINSDHFIILLTLTCSDRTFQWAFKVLSAGYGKTTIEKLDSDFVHRFSTRA